MTTIVSYDKILVGEGGLNHSAVPKNKFNTETVLFIKEKTKMRSTGIVRNIDELGRIVIPKELRNRLDMQEGTPVEIHFEGNKIAISKYYPGCHFCGSVTDDAKEFGGRLVCKECLDALAKL